MNIYDITNGEKEMRLKKEKVKIRLRAIAASQMESLKNSISLSHD